MCRKHHGPAGDQGAGVHKAVGAGTPAFLNIFPSIQPAIPCIEQYHHTPAVVFYPRAAVAADGGQAQLVAAAAIRLFGPVGGVDDGGGHGGFPFCRCGGVKGGQQGGQQDGGGVFHGILLTGINRFLPV